VLNLVAATLMLLYPQQALMLAFGFVLGGVAQMLFQLPALVRYGLLPPLGVWRHPQLRSVLLLMGPFTFTTGARQFLNFVSTNLQSRLSAGTVTAFSNADLFMGLALGLFSVSPALAFYSRLAGQVSSPEAFRSTLRQGLGFITFLTVPAGLLLSLYAEPALVLVFDWLPLFGGSGIDPVTLELSVLALAPLGLAVFPVGLSGLLLRTFYVRRSVRTPVLVTVVSTLLSALLYALLSRSLGIAGFSWTTVIVGWGQLAVLLLLVWQRERVGLRAVLMHALRVWGAALIALALVWLLLGALPPLGGWWGALLTLVLGGSGSVLLYLALCVRLGIPEVARLRAR
jgi:putative peptidoglycan lipid II flippase